MRRIAVVGGGWAGLAAAVESVTRGHAVTLYEMASHFGGRARKVEAGGDVLDNGQHILIGAYRETLRLMRQVGADAEALLLRQPLALVGPDGLGLVLPQGPAVQAFVRGVLKHPRWRLRDRISLLAAAATWRLQGFRCAPELTVAELCDRLSPMVRDELVEPLCVAALNTPAHEASATVFLRVLHDALFGGAGASDLLLPRRHLGAVLPEPAATWLEAHGAQLRTSSRVMTLQPVGDGWRVDAEVHDAVILATPPGEAARLAADRAPAWAESARALRYQPIVTVLLQAAGARLPQPMVALAAGGAAQYVFDLGQLGREPGRLAFVISGAQAWVERGLAAAEQAVVEQAGRELKALMPEPPRLLRTLIEKRATFACTPGLRRPAQAIAPGLAAAGDYCAGPYPATLEGAVRSGRAALDHIS